ncbi:SH3 domain-containing protein [Xylanimonas ulmi]|uniref:SH3 domain-containing protein n=1 Tax=Xylanimonas ulmi TaxID=228973 RepID=A0A4Q7M355_9MICO|nr:SH3 domain-containing protein [Xylanibacterium ulmi]RZS61393.1 SH3 domain-containing protein [Xylanibacterium ulmi]
MLTETKRPSRGPRRRRGLAVLSGAVTLLTAGTITFAIPAAADQSDGGTYRVYATREGLVGATTANGHVITPNDHFVALPSRRALSADGSGAYSVRVCAPSTGRCEYAPVWDVGPWNTQDDYWSATRHYAQDLPQGTPAAQAAYTSGYNGGLDAWGRTVLNPAGVDLADGTFGDGLGLADNATVDVTFLWQGDARTGVVASPTRPLNVRSGPSTGYRAVGLAANTAQVPLLCHARGQTVSGTRGTTNLWYRIGDGHWVSDAYLITGTGLPVAPPC